MSASSSGSTSSFGDCGRWATGPEQPPDAHDGNPALDEPMLASMKFARKGLPGVTCCDDE